MIRAYIRDRQGAAAVEFALMLGIFTLALPSVVDLGMYAYQAMQVRNSAQMGAQAAWAACNQLPATDNCMSATQSAVTTATQQTSLTTSVSVTGATEGYYCTNSSGALANAASNGKVGTLLPVASAQSLSSQVTTAPSDCSTLTSPKTSVPGDYLAVTVTYTYAPVFRNISVASLLGTTIQSTAWMRLL